MFLIRGAGLVLGSTDYSYCYFYILYVIYICYHYHVHLLVLLLQSLFIGIIVITTITYIINYIYICMGLCNSHNIHYQNLILRDTSHSALLEAAHASSESS